MLEAKLTTSRWAYLTALALTIALFAHSASAQTYTVNAGAKVNVNNFTIHSARNSASSVLKSVPRNHWLAILNCTVEPGPDWCYVTHSGTLGYARGAHLVYQGQDFEGRHPAFGPSLGGNVRNRAQKKSWGANR